MEFIELVGELKAIYDALVELASDEEAPPVVELTDEQRLQTLKDCTLLVRRLDLNIACFPLSESAAIMFDADGNPL